MTEQTLTNLVTAQDLYTLIAPLDCPYAITCPPTAYGETCQAETRLACRRYLALITPYSRFTLRKEVPR